MSKFIPETEHHKKLGEWLEAHPPQYSVTAHGFTFTLTSSVQVARMEQQLAVMTYSQIAKLHREIYGSTLPKNTPVGNGA